MKYLSVLTLSLLALGTWWLAFTQEPELDTSQVKSGNKIDYYLKTFDSYSMTLEGNKKQRVRAAFMQHFIDDDNTEMTEPVITMYSPEKPNLHIMSETGFISSDGELMLLNGAVNIRREALKDVAAIEVDTHNLRVQLADDFAETDEFVEIRSGISIIKGTGLRAHFRAPINIKILNHVRGTHVID